MTRQSTGEQRRADGGGQVEVPAGVLTGVPVTVLAEVAVIPGD